MDIEEKTKEVDELVEKTDEKSKETWMLAVGVAQSSWVLMDSIISAAGGTVSGILRATISGAFAAIAIMKPLLAAEAVTPGMQAFAAIGFFNIGLAIIAAIAAERQAGEIDVDISKFSRTLSSTNSWIRSFKTW